MTYRANPDFMLDIKKYGHLDIDACFNCGNCTAVCPLSTENDSFPRRVIRFAQLGLEDQLLSSKELWMCYYCGECTRTCPRQADPGEFMAAARRYAIAKYDRTGLAKWLYTSSVFNILFLTILTIVFGFFIYSFHGAMPLSGELKLFTFIPSEVVHDLGIIAGVIIAITALMGMVTMAIDVRKSVDIPKGARLNWIQALWEAVVVEALLQKRYRDDCEMYTKDPKPWYAQRWFVHISILWGFLGLFVATALNYLLELLKVKPTGTWVPLYYPIRFLGIVSGILLIYGTTVFLIRRIMKYDDMTKHSTPSDWSFLVLLWLSGLTGFALDVAIYLPHPHAWGYWMLILHLAIIGDLLMLAPFTKFAHAVYRTIALYFYALKPLPEEEKSQAPAAAD